MLFFGAGSAFCLKTGFGLFNLTFDLAGVIGYKLLLRMDYLEQVSSGAGEQVKDKISPCGRNDREAVEIASLRSQ